VDTTLSVLVVDDSSTMRTIIAGQLKELDFTDVALAPDGEVALKTANQKQYGLVLSDWEMQPMSGEAFLKALRQHPNHRKVPVILSTGTTMRGTSFLAGADAYLAKPFTAKDLETAIKRVFVKK
jgi:two-component system, chemotaxis family, chemotaxis protein CheY